MTYFGPLPQSDLLRDANKIWMDSEGYIRRDKRPMERLERDSTQTISNNSATTLTFTSIWDIGTLTPDYLTLSGGVGTIILAGVYRISAGVAWTSNATGRRRIAILKNSTEKSAEEDTAISGAQHEQAISTILYLDVDDTFEVQVRQTSGSDLDVVGNTKTNLCIEYLREIT